MTPSYFSGGPCFVTTEECDKIKATRVCPKCRRPVQLLWPAFMLQDEWLREIFKASTFVASCVPCGYVMSECPQEVLEEVEPEEPDFSTELTVDEIFEDFTQDPPCWN